jgi:hypothetical protein
MVGKQMTTKRKIVEIEGGEAETPPWSRPMTQCFACGQEKKFVFGEAKILGEREFSILSFCRDCFNAKTRTEKRIRKMYPGARIKRLPEGTERIERRIPNGNL